MLSIILEDVLNATENNSRRIVSSNHNLNSIHIEATDVDAALRQLSGVSTWDAAEYGITRERAAQMIEEAKTPAARERVMVDLRQRAIKRAGLDTSNGKIAVMVAGEPAWHRLGVNVASAVTAKEAIELASLNWKVEKRQLRYLLADGSSRNSSQFSLVRTDTEAELGVVGPLYQPILNEQGFDYLDNVIGKHGAKFHTAGSVFGGKKVWMQCELPKQSFEVVSGDKVDCYALFTNPHDGSGRAFVYPTSVRATCANTLRVSSNDRYKGIGIRHTGNVKASIADAQQALGLAVAGFEQFREVADEMVKTPVDATAFFSDLLDAVLDVTAADVLKGADVLAAAMATTTAQQELRQKELEREFKKRNNILEDIINRYESEKCGVSGIRGTAWAALNAVTEHTNWVKPGRVQGSETDRLSRRWESVVSGDGDAINQKAMEILVQVMRP